MLGRKFIYGDLSELDAIYVANTDSGTIAVVNTTTLTRMYNAFDICLLEGSNRSNQITYLPSTYLPSEAD